jgi:hypothetical protein
VELREMKRRTKSMIIIIPIAVVLYLLIGVGSQPYINTNVDEVAGITQFHVIRDGSITNVRFSLIDNNGNAAASDAMVNLRISSNYGDEFPVSANDFKQYRLQLTGQPVIAYAWQINESIDLDIGGTEAILIVTLPNGKVFRASDTVS